MMKLKMYLRWQKEGSLHSPIDKMKRLTRFLIAFLAGIAVLTAPMTASAATVVQSTQLNYSGYNNLSLAADKCNYTEPIFVYSPADGQKHPVLFYTHATLSDWSGNAEGKFVANLAAQDGFTAAAVTYDSWLTLSIPGVQGHDNCIYSPSESGNAVSKVCALPQSDCSKGIYVAGFSQGGAIAVLAANYNKAVKAAWVMGVSGPNIPEGNPPPNGTRVLPNNKLRIVDGYLDVDNQGNGPLDLSALQAETNSTSCTTTQLDCLQADGSGYYIVPNSAVTSGIAGHCYWMNPQNTCPTTLTPNVTGDPNWLLPSTVWGVWQNLDWLKAQ